MALIQDITFQKSKVVINARYALFDTDDYDNRLYVFEKDVWLAFSFPAYYGVGVRSYILVQYTVSPSVAIWLRWARTTYSIPIRLVRVAKPLSEIRGMILNFRQESGFK